ncbi:porin [Sutterella sp.]|uniref:porin n=1 Tax=Sutterella sp. TaxID=1981025 RepID=UPI0034CF4257
MRSAPRSLPRPLSPPPASAGSVKIGGMVDTGLKFSSVDAGGSQGSQQKLEMADGMLDANRIIFIGEEDLSERTKLGFWLEASYASDSGAMKTSGSLFDRGSYIFLNNQDYGQLAAGRIGLMRSGGTPLTFDITGRRVSPFGTGWGDLASPMYSMPFYGFPVSNMLQYDSPMIHGVQAHVQYSFQIDTSTGTEGKSSADRYGAFALTYDGGDLNLVGMVDWMNEATGTANPDPHDSWTFMLGGNYDFGVAKLYATATYFKDANNVWWLPGFDDTNYNLFNGCDQINGYSVTLGTKIPAWGGAINLSAMYLDADYDDEVTAETAAQIGTDLKRYTFVAGYEYPLSKQTTLYGAAGFFKDKVNYVSAGNTYDDPFVTQVIIGIHHNF